MIQFRKSNRLRVLRSSAPRFPFWAATTVSTAAPPTHGSLSIDLSELTATAPPKTVAVCADPRDQLARERPALAEPVLIDAAGVAEPTYRKGEEAAAFCDEESLEHTVVISIDGRVPDRLSDRASLVLVAWPPDPTELDRMAVEAGTLAKSWGCVVPILFPATTSLELLEEIARVAETRGATFLTGVPIDADAEAKSWLASTVEGLDDSDYSLLFHADLDTVLLATERHVAALAHERGMRDSVIPPGFDRLMNWNAATVLAIAGTRMVKMQRNVELGWEILRASATIAALDKPLTTIAERASLSIVDGLPEAAVDCLTEWLEMRSASLLHTIDEEWRLRRDVMQ